jgi:hypothetical protein
MRDPGLNQLEREVESARAKLANDLSRLRSPETAAEFTEGLKQEALEAKDALLAKAKASMQSSINSMIEELKARAAANPAATLAIGAGLAWRLLRHPPIATALVGVGLVSLFRTAPTRINGQDSSDYFAQAKTRLMEQATEAADMAKEKALALGDAVSQQVTKTAADVSERAKDLSEAARETSSTMWSKTAEQLKQGAESVVSVVATGAGGVDDHSSPFVQGSTQAETRDNLLLGAAGLAVVTALGLACQRRLADREAA